MKLSQVQVIDTGDAVYVEGLDETWLVAYCSNGYVCCCGWPESLVEEKRCTMKRKATPEQRLQLLREMACLDGSRGSHARCELEKITDQEGVRAE
jgi:hypothetical protein